MSQIDTGKLYLGEPDSRYTDFLLQPIPGMEGYIYPSSQVFSGNLILEGPAFYKHLQEIMEDKVVISLCSGDPRKSFHPERLAKLAKAKAYIAVDKNLSRYDYQASHPISPLETYGDTSIYTNQQIVSKLEDGTAFESMFIEEEVLLFLSKLTPSNGDRIFYISGIEPLMPEKYEREEQINTYLDYVCYELANKTSVGDHIIIEVSSTCIMDRLESSKIFEIEAQGEYHLCFTRKE